MSRSRVAILPVLSLAMIAAALGADSSDPPVTGSKSTYAYATNGVVDNVLSPLGNKWKLLLDKSNLGGDELEMVELTMPGGTNVGSHRHGAVEIIYVLSGVYGHEVNGKLYLLKPGMIGVVRPGDSVRHLVPKGDPARVLIIWAPSGEAGRVIPRGKGVTLAPVAEAKALEP